MKKNRRAHFRMAGYACHTICTSVFSFILQGYEKINNQFLNESIVLTNRIAGKRMKIKKIKPYLYNLIFFMFIRFPAILLVKTIDSYIHEFYAQGILHSDFQ